MDELPVKLATVEFRFPNMHKLLKVHQTQQNMFAIMRACKLFSAMFRREYGASLTCSEPEYDEATREDVLRVTGPAAADLETLRAALGIELAVAGDAELCRPVPDIAKLMKAPKITDEYRVSTPPLDGRAWAGIPG